MNTRLLQKGYDQKVINTTINLLVEKRYLDDEKFAKSFAQDKIKFKRIGPFALRSELNVHKIDQGIIERTIEESYNKYPIKELIIAHVTKFRKSSELTPKFKKRLVAALKRKGFSWDQIQDALDFHEN
jgi:regulatory protein